MRHRVHIHARSCGKHRFIDPAAAELELLRIRSTSERTQLPCRVYACTKCGGYHLTSMPKGVIAKS